MHRRDVRQTAEQIRIPLRDSVPSLERRRRKFANWKSADELVAARIDEEPSGQRGIREGKRAERVDQRRPQAGAPRILERWIRGSRRGR